MKEKKHRNFEKPNFTDDKGSLFLVRCYECDPDIGVENYGPAVATGQCAFCGWNKAKEVK